MRFRSDDPLEVKTAISRYVYDFMAGDITNPAHDFPSYYGAPDICLGQEPKTAIRFVDFYDGAIDIVCADSIDARGDVNLNNIANEIGDAVVFTNYFIAGLAAFTVNDEGQIAATEINGDGIVLTVADLVYLIRVIIGDALPLPKLSPYATTANFMTNGSVVSVDQVIGAAYFVFNGSVDVTLADGAGNMEIKSAVRDGNTHVLVYSFEKGASFTGNVLNANGTIKSIEAADYYGSAYKVSLVPSAFGVKNFPNPFNPATTIELALPVASNWSVSVYNVAGQKVFETSGYNEAGTHQITWDASTQASGIYFYKVDAGQYSVTKKMVLLK
jgi:hypothetical protein